MTEETTTLRSVLNLLAWCEPGPMFLDRPERWLDDPHWRCENDHVSTYVLSSEVEGYLCLAAGCHKPVLLTFPEDVDGPLVAPEYDGTEEKS